MKLFNKSTSKKALALAVCSVFILAGCSTSSNKTEEKKDEAIKINVGYYNCDHMVAAPVSEAAGIYKKHNLDVILTGNGKVPEAMAAGKMDAGYIGSKGMVAANAGGAPIICGANNHKGGSEYLVVANDVNSPQELLGQKVSIGNPEKDTSWLLGYSKELNLSTKPSDYELINIDSDKDKFLALSTGQIKAYTTCDPWGTMAEHEGKGKIMSTYSKMGDHTGICCGFVLNKNFISEHRDLAKELLKVHSESIQFIYENPKKAAEIFSKYYNVPYDVSLKTIYKKCVAEGRTLTWKIDETEFNHALKMYKEYKIIENVPDMNALFEKGLYEEAKLDDFDAFIKEKIDSKYPVGMSFDEFKKVAESL